MADSPVAHPPRPAIKPKHQPRHKTKQRCFDRAPTAKHTLGRAPKEEVKP